MAVPRSNPDLEPAIQFSEASPGNNLCPLITLSTLRILSIFNKEDPTCSTTTPTKAGTWMSIPSNFISQPLLRSRGLLRALRKILRQIWALCSTVVARLATSALPNGSIRDTVARPIWTIIVHTLLLSSRPFTGGMTPRCPTIIVLLCNFYLRGTPTCISPLV